MNSLHLLYSIMIIFIQFNKKRGKVIGDILKHSEDCKLLLENFASASASFMNCTLQNARPVHICCSCIQEYNRVLEEHDKITQKQNSTCKENLINQDRLEVIESGYSYVKDLWSKGQCKNCLANKDTLSKTTKEFVKLYSNTNQCLEDHFNPKNNSYSPDVCLICSNEYYKMSNFYAHLKETSGNGNVCMDIVDTVNVTQHLWSNVLHCGETVMTLELPLIAASVVFCLIPIFFYLCAWIFTKDTSSAVLNQNRVSQRFRERWRSRTSSGVSNGALN